jgi:signal transduction histidine kinase
VARTHDPSTRGPARHLFDGGTSTLIRDSVMPVLDEVRALLHADASLALYQTGDRAVSVLAATGDPPLELPLANEPLHSPSLSSHNAQPAALADLVLTSTQRPYRLELGAALCVPWRDSSGRGWLVVGNRPASWNHGRLDVTAAAPYVRALRRIHKDASYRGTIRTSQDLAAALKAVSAAGLGADDTGDLLEAIVIAARQLFGSSVAYIALPERDQQHFVFTSLVGIRTSEFRRLRMRLDQGLGGLARTERRAIRTMDYGTDHRLRAAPVVETRDEGIVSAMSAPLMINGTVAGSLYVGNRHQTSFSDTDADLLEEFAATATFGVTHQQAEEHRLAVMRQREQERLAFALHDTMVRSLMQIGFHAEEGLLTTEDADVKQRLAQIGQAAEYCLENLREKLAILSGDRVEDQDTSVGEIFEKLRVVPRRAQVSRTFDCRNGSRASELPEPIAKALTRIAQEALINAELHSSCTCEHVVVEISPEAVELSVTDDGTGMDAPTLAGIARDDSRHLGVRGMRATATELGGHVTFEAAEGRGLTVRASIPFRDSRAG